MKEHPITPPPELIAKWAASMCGYYEAARWGADMELEACCEWLVHNYNYPEAASPLRAARRPKPPSLKEQALELVDRIEKAESVWAMSELNTIRRALEALPD